MISWAMDFMTLAGRNSGGQATGGPGSSGIETLFDDGSGGVLDGALFDIRDQSAMSVNRDGTGPAPLPGEPVGVLADLRHLGGQTAGAYVSNNALPGLLSIPGHHVVADTDAERPIYQQDGSGRGYLSFSGNQGLMFSGAGLDIMRNVSGAVLAAAGDPSSWTANHPMIAFSQGTNSSVRALLGKANASPHLVISGRRLDSNAFQFIADTAYSGGAALRAVGLYDFANASATLRRDGQERAQAAFQTAGVTSNTRSLSGGLGRYATNSWAGTISRALVIARLTTAPETGMIETWLAG